MSAPAPTISRPAGPALSSRAKRWLYLTHRWTGIVLCLFFAMWFLSGVVMMYVGYPKLTPQERMTHLAPLDGAGIAVTPAQALAAAGASNLSGLSLAAVRAGAPVYLVPVGKQQAPKVVDAASGALLPPADAAVAMATASAWFDGQYSAHYQGAVQEDAYTHSRALDPHRPLHRVDMNDPARTRLYISSATGAVALDATRTERMWNYVGAWIHWLYPLRGNALNASWHSIVVWLSVAGVVVALTGTVVGILRWRFSRPYASGSRSPYRDGMMRWHHLSGLLFAVITITWIFSGLMSMNPWRLFTSHAAPLAESAYTGGPAAATPTQATPAALITALPGRVKELSWTRVDGQNLVLARGGAGAAHVLASNDARPYALDPDNLRRAAATLVPGAALVDVQMLDGYDFYYYARDEHAMLGHIEKPLPVWRLVFDNPQATWVYLEPRTGQIVSRQDRSHRSSRWLFAFLHSWDWPGLLARRPLWDAWLIFLSLGGMALSITGVTIGWRRLGKKLRI